MKAPGFAPGALEGAPPARRRGRAPGPLPSRRQGTCLGRCPPTVSEIRSHHRHGVLHQVGCSSYVPRRARGGRSPRRGQTRAWVCFTVIALLLRKPNAHVLTRIFFQLSSGFKRNSQKIRLFSLLFVLGAPAKYPATSK